ncbi:LytR C-terminal domain-containing protein [Zhihengliuella sp.]|uniref:LytR C-terminal domain-containing protein n=1 Tax=Zhihengliuella sp. TaxID=1954483 RepID=UPI00281137B5|nr:LytR C-terminal domain-containing protein [Zhihengliuella sp.]
MKRRTGEGPLEWDGRKVYTGADLEELTDAVDDPEHVENPEHYRRRLRHGIALVLVLLLVVAMGVAGYLVLTKRLDLSWPQPGSDAAAAPSEPACPPGERQYLDPAGVTVDVYNATSRPGLAEGTRAQLVDRGFRPGVLGNDSLPSRGMVGLVVSGPEGYDAALTVQRQLPGAAYERDDDMAGVTVRLVLGESFQELQPAAEVSTEPGPLVCR